MEGKEEPAELRGIIPQAFDHIFTEIAKGMLHIQQPAVRTGYAFWHTAHARACTVPICTSDQVWTIRKDSPSETVERM